ncbi:TetR family transcriptional regulator [Mesorhizobium sp. 1M-11]|uniref:TetR family transcriptional regulator n=1 Tax=Mesorhizobium sp. 1M-11 TaxID=1529006 RepID=UPI001FCD3CF1|nr:TetR family transcriptional regulator [Mesorhizobium sp. 1M-11]
MNAAEALILQKGIGPTTIEEITAGADVAKGHLLSPFFIQGRHSRSAMGAFRSQVCR